MKTILQLTMSVVFFFCFAFVVNAETELKEPAGCKSVVSNEKISKVRMHIKTMWTEDKFLRVAFHETTPVNLDKFRIDGIWSIISYNGGIVACQKATYFQDWDGERGLATYFKAGSIPCDARHTWVVQLTDNEGFSLYLSETKEQYLLPPKEISPLPEQFQGVRMISPPLAEPKAIPRPKPGPEKPFRRREGANPNLQELARA